MWLFGLWFHIDLNQTIILICKITTEWRRQKNRNSQLKLKSHQTKLWAILHRNKYHRKNNKISRNQQKFKSQRKLLKNNPYRREKFNNPLKKRWQIQLCRPQKKVKRVLCSLQKEIFPKVKTKTFPSNLILKKTFNRQLTKVWKSC